MPKSSSEKLTPSALMADILTMMSSTSSTSMLSVSSSLSLSAGAWWRCKALPTLVTNSGCASCEALTFTASVQCAVMGFLLHSRSCWQALSSTHSPSGRIMPVSSASGIKWAGDTSPRTRWFQRTSASAPVQRP